MDQSVFTDVFMNGIDHSTRQFMKLTTPKPSKKWSRTRKRWRWEEVRGAQAIPSATGSDHARHTIDQAWAYCECAASRSARNRSNEDSDYLFMARDDVGGHADASARLIDSGATQHITRSSACVKNCRAIKPVQVYLADNGTVEAIGCGDVEMVVVETASGPRKGVLTNVWHVLKLSRNLFSVSRFTEDVDPITFDVDKCFVNLKGASWTIGKRIGKRLFELSVTPVPVTNALAASESSPDSEAYLWHLRLGHIGHGGLDSIVKKKLGVGIDLISVSRWELCDGCGIDKQTRASFQDSTSLRSKGLLDIVHSEAWSNKRASRTRTKPTALPSVRCGVL